MLPPNTESEQPGHAMAWEVADRTGWTQRFAILTTRVRRSVPGCGVGWVHWSGSATLLSELALAASQSFGRLLPVSTTPKPSSAE